MECTMLLKVLRMLGTSPGDLSFDLNVCFLNLKLQKHFEIFQFGGLKNETS